MSKMTVNLGPGLWAMAPLGSEPPAMIIGPSGTFTHPWVSPWEFLYGIPSVVTFEVKSEEEWDTPFMVGDARTLYPMPALRPCMLGFEQREADGRCIFNQVHTSAPGVLTVDSGWSVYTIPPMVRPLDVQAYFTTKQGRRR
jgi:hypothetical protein